MAKRKLSTDTANNFPINWELCLFCQLENNENLICPANLKRENYSSKDTYAKIAGNIERFEKISKSPIALYFSSTDKETLTEDFVRNNASFHKNCRNKFNDLKIERAEKRFKANEELNLSASQNEQPQSTSCETSSRRSSTSSRTPIAKFETCYFCELPDDNLHQVLTFDVDKRVRKCALILEDSKLVGKLSEGDMVARDAMYHSTCLLDLYRRCAKKQKASSTDKNDGKIHGQALAELAQYMEQEAKDNSSANVFKIVDIAKLYKERVEELGGYAPERVHTSRLKNRLLANVENLVEYKDKKCSYLSFNKDVGNVLKFFYENDFDSEAFALALAAKIIRRNIFEKEEQKFDGQFSQNCQNDFVPPTLKLFIDSVLQGSKINNKNMGLEQPTLTISQLIIQSCMKRARPNQESQKIVRSSSRESPIGIYIGMMVHSKTRKKALIDKLYKLGISISYSRVMELSTKLGNRALSLYDEMDLVCPNSLKLNLFTTGALDNIDHNPTSTTSESAFHGTSISLFQHRSENDNPVNQIVENVLPGDKKLLNLPDTYTNIQPVSQFEGKPEISSYPSLTFDILQKNKNNDQTDVEDSWLKQVECVISKTDNRLVDDISWSAYNASMSTGIIEKDLSTLLPLFRESSKSAAMIKHGMNIVKATTAYLNSGQTPVIAFDQPLYSLAKLVQWNWKESYGESKFVTMMGPLHIEMAALKTIGDWLKGSGWCAALVEAKIASTGKADSFLHASHVSRTRASHQVTASALHILMQQAYTTYNQSSNQPNHTFHEWRKNCEECFPQFRFWSITLKLELLVLSFVRSIRSGNFELYTQAIQSLLPWFFALDHINYARWLSVHLADMLQLAESNPEIDAAFRNGMFVVKKTCRKFSALGIDHAHEQNNKCVKGDGGAVGLTENSKELLRWMVCGPELARCITEFETNLTSFSLDEFEVMEEVSEKHHEQTRSMQNRFTSQVSNLVRVISDMGNPFEEQSKDLYVLDTRNIVNESIITTVTSIETLGDNQFNEFMEKRIIQREKSLFEPIKRNKLPTFGGEHVRKNTSTKNQSQIVSLKKNCQLFSQMFIACQVRDGDLVEFFCHENQTYPPSISSNGVLRSGAKSDLLSCLEDVAAATQDKPQVECVVFDGPAIVNMLFPANCTTFNDYSSNVFCPYVSNHLQFPCKRIDVIWDVYIKNSLKATARNKRGQGIRRRVLADTKIPTNWNSFLRVDENKVELFKLLANDLAKNESEGLIVSTIEQLVLSNRIIDKSIIEPCNQEEADTRIFLHVYHANMNGVRKVMIRTVDTDVVVIGIGLFQKIDLDEMWVWFGTGKHQRYIPLHELVQQLGPRTQCLPLFHSITGCDQVSFFLGKGKRASWSTWKKFDDLTEALSKISFCPSKEEIENIFTVIERFIVLLYDRASLQSRVNECRKELFSKKGRMPENIPPTRDALIQHCLRAIYQASYCWAQSLIKCPELPDPCEWGWEKGGDIYDIRWTTIPEVSKISNELIRCGCKRENGCSGRCKCAKASLQCTALCNCGGECES